MADRGDQDVLAKRAVIAGRVQGVFFRESTRREAETFGVVGWVRNRSDGTVEVWAEGPPAAVDALLAYCQAGPPAATVEKVRIEDQPPAGLSAFEVR